MNHQQDRGRSGPGTDAGETLVGVDMGATLTKLAVQRPAPDGGRSVELATFPSSELAAIAEHLESLAAARVGLTGGGAARLSERLACPIAQVNEFAAWGAGARSLIAASDAPDPGRFIVVSLGTGTSVLLVDGLATQRIGGTALGGGTVIGLGCALTGAADFAKLCALAEEGQSRGVDLLVSDIYRPGEIALSGDITAANFGRLAAAREASPADLAAGVMNLVGENVGLVCVGLAAAAQVTQIAFGGSTLPGNPALVRSLITVTAALGREPTLLEGGEHAGALGALELVRAHA